MKLFLDTSSLVKLYCIEEGSSDVDSLFSNFGCNRIGFSNFSSE
ncbi:MAG: type II toxin-antitoxin system VapC family toxin [Ignavibacteria bacterium]|nr:type II toxin-antitoxin system VapC family toxin [Ignavibacteria bacterium]